MPTGTPAATPAPGATPSPNPDLAEADKTLLEDSLRHGPMRLRFEPRLEHRFQRDIAAARTARIAVCNALGVIFNWLNTLGDAQLMPTLAPLMTPLRDGGFVFTLVAAALLFWKRRTAPAWLVDSVTAFGSLLIVAYVLVAAHDPPDQLAVLIRMGGVHLVFLHAGLAARLRFSYVLGLGVMTIGGYHLLAARGGTGSEQAMVVAGNLRLFVTSLGYVLVANYVIEYRQRRHYLLRALQTHRQRALADAAETLRRLSRSDALTGLANRRSFDDALRTAWHTAMASGEAVAVLQIDVDFFKRYNDRHGHPAGDLCLQRIATALSMVSARHDGLAARTGGEEFAMLLPGRTPAAAVRIADQLLRGVRALQLPHLDSPVADHVTVSIGVAAAVPRQPPATAQALILAADTALYTAKHGGRDRACRAPGLPGQAEAAAAATCGGAMPDPASEAAGSSGDAVIGDDTSATLASRVEVLQHALSRGLRQLRFPPALEAQYAATGSHRKRGPLLCGLGLGGLLYALAYLHLSRALISDVADRIPACDVALLVTLVPALLALLRPMPRQLREALFCGCVVGLTLGMALLIAPSRLMTAHSYALSTFLIPMFSAVIAAQPFRYSVVASVVGWTLIAAATAPVGGPPPPIWIEVSTMGLDGCLFALIGSYLMEHGARREHLLTRLAEAQGELLGHTTSRLRELSDSDPLTGMSNRRKFDRELERLLADCASARQTLAVLVVDVDHFKRYNDSLGHVAGDACLRQVARALAGWADGQLASPGREPVAARIGGEEFALLLPGHDAAAAGAVADVLCRVVRSLAVGHPDSPVAAHVTVSVGVASILPAPGERASALLQSADEALYAAKHLGRDRAVHWGTPGRATLESVTPERGISAGSRRDEDQSVLWRDTPAASS